MRSVTTENESVSVTVGAADLACAWRQARTLRDTGHRPWPVPDGPWIMGQSWERLLFAHWRIDQARLRRFVPPLIPLDTFDGSAWIGVTPFLVGGLRLRFLPPLPGTARFPEINVRTYATIEERPGIYFFSLDVPERPGDRGGPPRLSTAVLSLKDRRQARRRTG
jgi:hypothetical protein